MLVAAGSAVLLLGPAASWIQLLAAGAAVAVGIGLWRAGWLGSRHRIVELRALPEQFSADTRLIRNAVWLGWRTPGGRKRSMLLLRDDLPAGQLRTLCIRLRIEALERVLPEAPTR